MFLPPTKRILCFLSAQKPNAVPLEEKNIFFQKSSLIYTRISKIIRKKYVRNRIKINVFWPMQPRARSVRADLLLSGACTRLHGPKYDFKHTGVPHCSLCSLCSLKNGNCSFFFKEHLSRTNVLYFWK